MASLQTSPSYLLWICKDNCLEIAAVGAKNPKCMQKSLQGTVVTDTDFKDHLTNVQVYVSQTVFTYFEFGSKFVGCSSEAKIIV